MKKDLLKISLDRRELVGDFYIPETENPCPLVIFSHGFNGSGKDFSMNCRLLAKHNIAAFSFDFCGGSVNARSSMATTDMTIFTEMEDLCGVIDFMKKDSRIDAKNIFLFGASQGGFVSALVADERPADIGGLLLLYPALCIPDDWNQNFPRLSDIPESFNLWGMTLGHDFFSSLHGFKTFDHIGKFPRNVLVIHGNLDEIVPIRYIEKLPATYAHAAVQVFPGEGHGFSDAGNQRVAEMTVEFVEKNKI